MKIKAVIHPDMPKELEDFLNDGIGVQIKKDVLIPHLHMPLFTGPAEAYIQECDKARGCGNNGWLCEVRLSGVSVSKSRSHDDFVAALDALADCYRQAIQKYVPRPIEVQLFVAIMTDRNIPFTETNLLEIRPEYVAGQAAMD